MTTFIKNSAYKVKMGTVQNTLSLPPERGALVFSIDDHGVFLGDGFNWLTFEASTLGAAVTGTDFIDAMTSGVPVITAEYFDAVLYNLGGALTISIPAQTVTVVTAGDYRINWIFNVSCSLPSATLHFDISVDGTPAGHFDVFMKNKDLPVSSSGSFVIPGLLGTEVLTLDMELDKTATINRFGQQVGFSKIA